MKKWTILILLALLAILADGIIMPAFLGIKESFLTLIMLAAIIVTFGVQRWVVWFGLALAFIAEFSFGLFLGSLMLPWILVLWLWYGLTSVFSLKPFAETEGYHFVIHGCVGLFILTTFSTAYVALEKIFFDRQAGYAVLSMAIRQPSVWLTAAAGMTAFLFLFRLAQTRTKTLFM